MKPLLAILVLGLAWATPVAATEPMALSPAADTALVRLLNDMEALATRHEGPPFAVQVIRVRDQGECDGTPESCPQAAVYITVSAYDETPDQAVYVLPKAHGWRFVEWTHVPERDGPDDFVRFTLERDDPSPTPENGWWTATRQEVAVNPWRASIQPLPGTATP